MKNSYIIALAVSSVLSIAAVSAGEDDERKGGRGEERGRPDGPPRGGPRGDMMKHMPVLVALDADKDGKISAEEIANAPAALKTLDKNGDGILTVEELRPPRPPRGEEPRGKRPPRPSDDNDGSEGKERGQGMKKKGQDPTGGGGVEPKRPSADE